VSRRGPVGAWSAPAVVGANTLVLSGGTREDGDREVTLG